MITEKCCDILKKKPFAKYTKETNSIPIIGTRVEESFLRRNQYCRRGGCNSFNKNHLASYPLSIWTHEDIENYIKLFKVRICDIYNNPECDRTGCMFCGFGVHREKKSRFEFLFRLHPGYYRTCLNYTNNNVTYRQALHKIGIVLPDEVRQLEIDF